MKPLNAVFWSRTPIDLTVRVENVVVHRVARIIGGRNTKDHAVLGCGVQVPMSEVTTTRGNVDCMWCLIRPTSRAKESTWISLGATYVVWP